MAEVGSAFVSLLPSAKGFGKKLDGQIGGDLDKSGASGAKRFGGAFKGALGPLLAGAGALAIGGFFKGAIDDASDLSESASKVGVVFGDQAKQIMKASKTSARAMGLTKSAYLDATGTLGNLLVSLDIAPKKSAAMSQQMVQLAGDLASFNNTSPEEALDALKSGLTGETEPLKRFGVNMNDATLKAQALKMGLIKNTKEALNPQTKALAAQALIMAQTGTAQGDFARTSGGLANQQRILTAQFGNLKATVGRALLPVFTTLVSFVNDKIIPGLRDLGGRLGDAGTKVRNFFNEGKGNPAAVAAIDRIKDAAGNIGDGFRASIKMLDEFKTKLGTLNLNNLNGDKIGAALSTAVGKAVSSIAKLGTKIAAAFGQMLKDVDWVGLGIKAGPAVIGVVLGLSAGIINGITDPGLWKNIWDNLPEILFALLAIAFAPSKLAGPIAKILGRIPIAGKLLEGIITGLQKIGGRITSAGGSLLRQFWRGFTEAPLGSFAGVVGRILKALGSIPGRIRGFFSLLKVRIGVWALDAFEAMGRGARAAIPKVIGFVASIPGRILRALGSLARLLFPRGTAVVNGLVAGIRGKIGSVTSVLQGLPGKIVSAVGSLGHVLFNAGGSIISGLISGITSKMGALRSKLGSVSKFITDHKGPPSYDAVMLTPAGRLIMGGLIAGIDQGIPPLGSKLSEVNNRLASSVSVPNGARLSPSSMNGAGAGGSLDSLSPRAIREALDGMALEVELTGGDRAKAKFVQAGLRAGARL